jgi:AraC family transcriptional regulator
MLVNGKKENNNVSEFDIRYVFKYATLTVKDTYCKGACRHQSPEEYTTTTQLVFPYRGIYVRHVGQNQTVAEANQMLFFNAMQGYRVSHPLPGGDASLTLVIDESSLDELAPRALLSDDSTLTFRQQRMRIDARAQLLVALLRHKLQRNLSEPLELESLAMGLARRSLGQQNSGKVCVTYGLQRLVDRVKLVLASDLSRRWTLAEIVTEVRGSPVYLTQIFHQVEGLPLYRYQLRLRLARALDLLGEYDDLSSLGFDLGFSSHSHFTASFRRVYGRSPSEFRQTALHR